MKKSIIAGLIVLALLAGTSVWPHRAGADQSLTDKIRAVSEASHLGQAHPWVVVLQGQWDYPENTYSVSILSSSAGAPKIQLGDDLAEALSVLRAAGGQITLNTSGYITYTVQSQ